MRALFKPSAAPGLEMIECAEPTPGPNDVKIRVEKTGICGTDLHIESWDAWAASAVNAPLIIGHEFSGRIVELGADVTSLDVGALVSGEGHIICGTCRNCRAGRRHMCKNTSSVGVNRNGAFAEYVVIPASNVWVHSHAVDAELGAIFDPFGNAVHTALTFPVAGEDVLITGAGPIGLMAAKVARHVGARYVVVSDINESRLELARSMGVDIAANPLTSSIAATQKALGMKEGFDVALEMSGAPTALPDILDNLSHGGRIALLGLPSKEISINWAKLVTHMITIKGIYGREMYETWYAMNSLIQTGLDIRDVITDRFPANDWEKAFDDIQTAGLYKRERLLDSPQASHVLSSKKDLINFCSNNYIGLANNPAVIAAAKESLDVNGFGMASVRFICGTQSQHDVLEARLSALLGTDATILFPSCFDANGGVFEVLLDQGDAVISDELNHASIIDGIRLCKATRYRYKNRDMADLEVQLKAASGARRILVVTDGVFSMDGSFAPLNEICDLADTYKAMVMVDDSHAVGFIGATGAGTPEMFNVRDRVDIISGTLGKALGGASGGYISAHQEIVDLLRQRARPYLFSNSIPPTVVAGSLVALDLVSQGAGVRDTLRENAKYFRNEMTAAGFTLLPGEHPVIPVMFADEHEAARMASELFTLGIYVVAFSYPVVPMGKARIRVQVCATHTKADIDTCVAAFVTARDKK